MFLFFFFQAEDGIRDLIVTGVQTCALPISAASGRRRWHGGPSTSARPTAWPSATATNDGTGLAGAGAAEIGRASGRGRVEISVGAVSLKKKKTEEWSCCRIFE